MKILLSLVVIGLSWIGIANADNSYSVYGNNTFNASGFPDNCYHPENYGSVLLGTSNRTETFAGAYNHYIVTSDLGDVALIDALQGSNGTYLSPNYIGNTPDYQNAKGAPDGVFAHMGAIDSYGCLALDVTGEELTSITVYSPAPYYCDDDNDGYYDSTSDGLCIGAGCIPSGCQATAGDDCDDTLTSGAAMHPGASELCDKIDNNCNGAIDEGLEQQDTISGMVYYSGSQTGLIHIAAADINNNYNSAAETTIPSPGPYSLSLPSGDYYIVAQMDVDISGSFSLDSFQRSEPSGHYGADCSLDDAVIIPYCALQNIDIYLSDFNQTSVLRDSFGADYFSGNAMDMGYHDGYLWIVDFTHSSTGPVDIRKVNPTNGQLVESFDLNIDFVTSLEWIGNDMWVSFKAATWVIRQYTYNGTAFTEGVSYNLPSSVDWNIVWSINIAWDGNLMWVQEKGSCVNIYKINLSDGSIVETISGNEFGKNKKVGLGDIADISFEDGFLWAMDDDNPNFVRIDPTEPVTSPGINYTFDLNKYSFDEDARYYGMVKHGDLFYFLQKPIRDSPHYVLLTADLDDSILSGDINNDGNIDLVDTILALKVMSNTPLPVPVFKEADINNDGFIGLEETLYALQFIAEIRP